MKLDAVELMLAADEADWQRVASVMSRSFQDMEAAEAIAFPISIVLSQTHMMTEFQLRYKNKIFIWRDRDGFSVFPYSVAYEKPMLVVWHRLARE